MAAKKKTKAPPTKPVDESVEKPATPAPSPDQHIATVGDLNAAQRGYATGAETEELRQDIANLRTATGQHQREAPKAPRNAVPVDIQTKAGEIRQRLARQGLHLDGVLTSNLEGAALGRHALWGAAIEAGTMAAIREGEALLTARAQERTAKVAAAESVVRIRVFGKILLSGLSRLGRGEHEITPAEYATLTQWVQEIEAQARAKGGNFGAALGRSPSAWPPFAKID